MAKNVYLFNPTVTPLQVMVNTQRGTPFNVPATSRDKKWAAGTSENPVPRSGKDNEPYNEIGKNKNTLHVYAGEADESVPVTIDVGEIQTADDLAIYLFYDNGKFKFTLLHEGVVVDQPK